MNSNIDNTIPGGFLFTPRAGYDFLEGKPPLQRALWDWLTRKANWKDRDKLKRGQLVTSGPEMQEAMSHYVGFRKTRPTVDEIRSAYEALVKAGAITVRKAARGMVITIVNYDFYQTGANYEARRETRNEDGMNPDTTPDVTEEEQERNFTTTVAPWNPQGEFERLCSFYPNVGDKEAAWAEWESCKSPGMFRYRIAPQVHYDRKEVWGWGPGGYVSPPPLADWLKARPWIEEDEIESVVVAEILALDKEFPLLRGMWGNG